MDCSTEVGTIQYFSSTVDARLSIGADSLDSFLKSERLPERSIRLHFVADCM